MEMARTFGGKKFMWDGRVYESAVEAEEIRQSYQTDGFTPYPIIKGNLSYTGLQ